MASYRSGKQNKLMNCCLLRSDEGYVIELANL